MTVAEKRQLKDQLVKVTAGSTALEGTLDIPEQAEGLVLFAHGSGSSRFSPRNRFVAQMLREGGLATLLIDLLTPNEEEVDWLTRQYRFDIDLLADRLIEITGWLLHYPPTQLLKIGYFGSSTGAAAALIAAAKCPDHIQAVVSRGGRPDLAAAALPEVKAPTLLIVGGADLPVISLNKQAFGRLRSEKKLEIVPGATHLFEEPGALDEVARLACQWFLQHLSFRSPDQSK
jgi:pimeloyl-ACP methyl ester carboxylesterase